MNNTTKAIQLIGHLMDAIDSGDLYTYGIASRLLIRMGFESAEVNGLKLTAVGNSIMIEPATAGANWPTAKVGANSHTEEANEPTAQQSIKRGA